MWNFPELVPGFGQQGIVLRSSFDGPWFSPVRPDVEDLCGADSDDRGVMDVEFADLAAVGQVALLAGHRLVERKRGL